jgi:hypothetical protein
MEQLGDLMNLVDDIKEKIDDAQYKGLVDKLKSINDNRDYPDLYLVKYWEQYTKIVPRNQEQYLPRNRIVLKKKYIIAKFCRKTFHSEEDIDDFIKNFEDKTFFYIRTNNGFPLIEYTHHRERGSVIPFNQEDRERSEDDVEFLEYEEFIPISIKKI